MNLANIQSPNEANLSSSKTSKTRTELHQSRLLSQEMAQLAKITSDSENSRMKRTKAIMDLQMSQQGIFSSHPMKSRAETNSGPTHQKMRPSKVMQARNTRRRPARDRMKSKHSYRDSISWTLLACLNSKSLRRGMSQ